MRYSVAIVVGVFALAQTAIVQAAQLQGRVVEPATGAPVGGATVRVAGSDAEAITDAQGQYQIEVEPGTYTLEITAGGQYEQKTVEGVEVTGDGPVTRKIELERSASEDVAEYSEYTVKRGYVQGTTGSVLSKQQEAEAVTEIIGSENMSRSGDSNAADSVSRLTGLTVAEDKFAVIRGQPKRYTSTLLNGSPLPSIDPIRNLTPLDLFPAQALSNITVQKTYSVDQQASFGAGQIQMNTIGSPEEDFATVAVSTGVNSESTGEDGKEFATGDDELAGIDNVLQLPGDVQSAADSGEINSASSSERAELGRSFSNELEPSSTTLGPDFGLSAAAGKRIELDTGTLGIRFAGGWSREQRQEQERRRVIRLGGGSDIVVRDSFTENRTEINTNISGLTAITWETDAHKLASNTFVVRDATEKTQIDRGLFQPSDTQNLERTLLEYEQRQMILQQFSGEHELGDFDLGWRGQYSDAERELPDRRRYQYEFSDSSFSGTGELDPNPDLIRRFNTVEEETTSLGADLTYPLVASSALELDLTGGFDIERRDRESTTRTFKFTTTGDRSRPIEEIFADSEFGGTADLEAPGGTADDYSGKADVDGVFAKADATVPEQFRVTAGLRFERADYEVTTFQSGGQAGPQPVTSGFDREEVLPSLVGSWFLTDNQQLRAGWTRTVSYPVLVEVSDTTFINPDTNERFRGNPDLQPATIDSLDARWEWYPTPTEALTVGAFYKEYTDPIERVFNTVAGGGDNITLANADTAEVYGLEFSGRVQFSRFATAISGEEGLQWMRNMYAQGNLALMDSEVTLPEGRTTATNPNRGLEGQADTLLNFQLGYRGSAHTAALTFSRVGERLETAGTRGLPDEFRQPVIDVGAKWSYSVTDAATASIELENLTNEEIEFTRGDITTSSLSKGTTGKFSFSYRF